MNLYTGVHVVPHVLNCQLPGFGTDLVLDMLMSLIVCSTIRLARVIVLDVKQTRL